MATELDEGSREARSFEVQSVGIASVSYDDESKAIFGKSIAKCKRANTGVRVKIRKAQNARTENYVDLREKK